MSVWSLAGLCAGVSIVLSVVGYALVLGIGPVPTSRPVKRRLSDLLPDKAQLIAELGCGWGTLLRPLSRRYPKGRITAYERSPIPWCLAQIGSLFLPNVCVRCKNFFSASLDGADLVVCYLYPKAMQRLSAKFKRELKPGAWIVSHTFALPDWTPERLIHADDLYHTPIYLYRVPSEETGSPGRLKVEAASDSINVKNFSCKV